MQQARSIAVSSKQCPDK